MTGELKKYEATFRFTLPGYTRESECKVVVAADEPAEATLKAIEEFKKAIDPKDVRIKEIAKVMTA